MSEKEEVKNMELDKNPYLEKPETFDPTEKNKDEKYGGGGEDENDSKK